MYAPEEQCAYPGWNPSGRGAGARGPPAVVGNNASPGRLRDSFFPDVEALAGLLPELAGADHLAQQGGGAELLAELAVQVVENGEAHVEADEVRELERPHRVAVPELHRLVDVGGAGDAALEHA